MLGSIPHRSATGRLGEVLSRQVFLNGAGAEDACRHVRREFRAAAYAVQIAGSTYTGEHCSSKACELRKKKCELELVFEDRELGANTAHGGRFSSASAVSSATD